MAEREAAAPDRLRVASAWSAASEFDAEADEADDPESGAGAGSLVVFSGGTAFNSTASVLKRRTTQVAYVLPVSDDGGSTKGLAVRNLLGHRLDAGDENVARQEWLRIAEGSHELWVGVGDPYKHTIRAFLVHFQAEVLSSGSASKFTYANGSIGNFFFAGARTFFQSIEAAIFMYHRVSGVAPRSEVLPVIVSERRISLAAELASGAIIRGQNAISHPSKAQLKLERQQSGPDKAWDVEGTSGGDPNIVTKQNTAPLPSPIKRIFYLSSDGDHEIAPGANPAVMRELATSRAIVFGMGSLYTSIVPCLVLPGVGEAVQAAQVPKVLLLNGTPDRESGDLSASGFVRAITDALNRKGSRPGIAHELDHPPTAYITRLVYPEGSRVRVDLDALEAAGIEAVACESVERVSKTSGATSIIFDTEALCDLLATL